PKAQRPLAFERPVSLLVTALAAIETSRPGLVLEERAPGASVAAIPAATAAPLIVPGSVPEMAIGPAGGDG
ncbi:MAG: hypothetical protein N3D77_13095, partial [Geminicoccaceae bacterium]|nr:hypothetical protein [Geminicoccaceae bacterium]